MRIAMRAAALLSIAAGSLRGQEAGYTPSTKLPNGKEIVAVYIGAQDCGACNFPEVKAAVRQMKTLVAAQAHKSNAAFSAIGVANDWDQAVAASFIATVGPFDQVVLGANWTNLGIEHFMWRDTTAMPAMPQIVVLERTVTMGRRFQFSEPHVLRRLIGSKEIPEWVAKGAPISP